LQTFIIPARGRLSRRIDNSRPACLKKTKSKTKQNDCVHIHSKYFKIMLTVGVVPAPVIPATLVIRLEEQGLRPGQGKNSRPCPKKQK
jgi:hypothetical protein